MCKAENLLNRCFDGLQSKLVFVCYCGKDRCACKQVPNAPEFSGFKMDHF